MDLASANSRLSKFIFGAGLGGHHWAMQKYLGQDLNLHWSSVNKGFLTTRSPGNSPHSSILPVDIFKCPPPRRPRPPVDQTLLLFEQSSGVKLGFPIFIQAAWCLSLGCRGVGHCSRHSRFCRLTFSKEAERSINDRCLTVTSLPQILDKPDFSSHNFQFVQLGETGDPLSQHWQKQILPLAAKKFVKLQNSLVLWY